MAESSGYQTRQRASILAYLIHNQARHITADDIFAHLAAQGTPVGKSTVYRYLDQLVRQNVVRRYQWEEGERACYQYIQEGCGEHFHMKCTQCGALIHLECAELGRLLEHLSAAHQFQVDHTKTVLYGRCAACMRGNEGDTK